MHHGVHILSLLVGLAALVAGCSSSRAVGTSAGCATAVIVPENQFNRSRAAGPFAAPCATGQVIVRVDGCPLKGKRQFQVPAGQQRLQVAFTDENTPNADGWDDMVLTTRAVAMSFEAQAGHTYAVRGQADWRGARPVVTLWIVDGADGRTVTSLVVPEQNIQMRESGWRLLGG